MAFLSVVNKVTAGTIPAKPVIRYCSAIAPVNDTVVNFLINHPTAFVNAVTKQLSSSQNNCWVNVNGNWRQSILQGL